MKTIKAFLAVGTLLLAVACSNGTTAPPYLHTCNFDWRVVQITAPSQSFTPDGKEAGICSCGEIQYRAISAFNPEDFTAGLYRHPISANSTPVDKATLPAGPTGATIIERVIAHLNANAGEYTLLIDEGITVTLQGHHRWLRSDNASLTLIGIGGGQVISLGANELMFALGYPVQPQNTMRLTLGNNITLEGREGSNSFLVSVRDNAVLTMLEGSQIRSNSNPRAPESDAAAVVLEWGGSFYMFGGTITGNKATHESSHNAGGIFARNPNTRITLLGGRIEGNNGLAGDIMVMHEAAVTLGGTAHVGTLTLNAASTTNRSVLTINQSWSGNVKNLNLRVNHTGILNTTAWWVTENPLLTGKGLNSAAIERITLGNFMTSGVTPADSVPVIDTHRIATTGAQIGRLVAR